MKSIDTRGFQQDLLGWYHNNKRDLPWRKDGDPYKIWVSEIMLQQTRVDTVIPYFNHFMRLFPTIKDLAEADEETVLKAWEGLGYYSRARNLHTAVNEVQEHYGGVIPADPVSIRKLKGIGPYTAGAISSIAFHYPEPAVDGNVMRVLARIFTICDDIAKNGARKRFEAIVREIIAENEAADFNQALMELGAMICTPRDPDCHSCPVAEHCYAREEGVQAYLPVKAKKKPPKNVYLDTYVVVNAGGELLIEQRSDTGLLAKLWQFPMTEKEQEQEKLQDEVSYVQHVKHVFSHLVWEMDVYLLQIGEEEEQAWLEANERRKFVHPDDLTLYPFPVSHQKIIDGAIADNMN
ncbi:A/G-specific adenine glycosylase [Salisediminibacterium halotolerans]|uniref:Adenine DNA glycosylase n=1 Tax=Salisediminibacterium halotolerans TaxID=517425 RepID=A0A1H9WQD7_9BACI|nr:A/G-specific adenine glycosylase [Salisediminibacterium haloalkalitolerans]SES36138.1 A/G-specific adenine glycosylase [Salisediminibacterium haloalkalitolerans]